MRKYSSLLAAVLMWWSTEVYGPEDVAWFLNQLPRVRAEEAKVVPVPGGGYKGETTFVVIYRADAPFEWD